MLQQTEVQFDHLTFSSKFDSGNCARVEQVRSKEYCVWTAPDCAGTCFETTYTTWFYFSVKGGKRGEELIITMMNMNKQTGLYANDYRPIVRSLPSKPEWARLKVAPRYKVHDMLHPDPEDN